MEFQCITGIKWPDGFYHITEGRYFPVAFSFRQAYNLFWTFPIVFDKVCALVVLWYPLPGKHEWVHSGSLPKSRPAVPKLGHDSLRSFTSLQDRLLDLGRIPDLDLWQIGHDKKHVHLYRVTWSIGVIQSTNHILIARFKYSMLI